MGSGKFLYEGTIERLRTLEKLGVTFGAGYSRNRLRDPGNLLGAEAEVCVVESLGPRVGYSTMRLSLATDGDVDVGFVYQAHRYGAQVKCFDLLDSSFGTRIISAGKQFDMDAIHAELGNFYFRRQFMGEELANQNVQSIKGVHRKASIGIETFEPDVFDLIKMRKAIYQRLNKALKQLDSVDSVRIVIFDIRRSQFSPVLLYNVVLALLGHFSPRYNALDCVAIIWYDLTAKDFQPNYDIYPICINIKNAGLIEKLNLNLSYPMYKVGVRWI